MRVVICADAHLDSVHPIFNNNSAKLRLRQEEQRLAFTKAINEVKRIDAHALLLPGDLFNEGTVSQDTLDFLIDSFKSIPETFVLISPGNNDPASFDSCYFSASWPENVFIFKRGLEALELTYDDSEEKVRVYGAAFQGHSCKNSLLRHNNTLPILDKNFINILVMHGSVASADTSCTCNPIFVKDLDICGFDFCALGHLHKYSDIVKTENSAYSYTGPCEGRGFSEIGPCGVLSGTITKDTIALDFIKTSIREHYILNVDITGLDSYDAVLDRIRMNCTNSEFIYKIYLTGKKNFDLKLSVSKLTADLSSEYFYIKIIANYSDEINLELLKHENSLRGCYVRCLLEKEGTIADTEIFNSAMSFGLQSFEGEVFLNDNP